MLRLGLPIEWVCLTDGAIHSFSALDSWHQWQIHRGAMGEIAPPPRVNSGSMARGSMGQIGQFLDGPYGSWVDALSPMTHLHIYRKHVVKATFVVGDN